MHDLIIIGGGAAGLSAAVYALGRELDVVAIYEEFGKAGTQQQIKGQAGEEYLAGAEAVQLFERRVVAHADVTLHDRVVALTKSGGVFQVQTQHHGTQNATAVILATGASPLQLNVPGAKSLLNHGIGYSITTHAQLVAGKTVAVIGTTRRALRGVVELARTAAQIYLIAPDATGMTTPLARSLKEIAGTHSVEHVVVVRDGEESTLRVDAVFADFGLLPNSGIARQLARVDADGFILIDDKNATTTPGLFAAGDVTTAFGENILIAIGDGARAAVSAYEYILAHPSAQDAEPSD